MTRIVYLATKDILGCSNYSCILLTPVFYSSIRPESRHQTLCHPTMVRYANRILWLPAWSAAGTADDTNHIGEATGMEVIWISLGTFMIHEVLYCAASMEQPHPHYVCRKSPVDSRTIDWNYSIQSAAVMRKRDLQRSQGSFSLSRFANGEEAICLVMMMMKIVFGCISIVFSLHYFQYLMYIEFS